MATTDLTKGLNYGWRGRQGTRVGRDPIAWRVSDEVAPTQDVERSRPLVLVNRCALPRRQPCVENPDPWVLDQNRVVVWRSHRCVKFRRVWRRVCHRLGLGSDAGVERQRSRSPQTNASVFVGFLLSRPCVLVPEAGVQCRTNICGRCTWRCYTHRNGVFVSIAFL